MRFKKIELEEAVEYEGKIVAWSIDSDKRFFRIFIELDGLDGIQFMKCIRFAEFAPSVLSEFCEMFDIIAKNGDVDFDDLLEIPVIVTLNKGRDGNFYVAQIEPTDGDDYED